MDKDQSLAVSSLAAIIESLRTVGSETSVCGQTVRREVLRSKPRGNRKAGHHCIFQPHRGHRRRLCDRSLQREIIPAISPTQRRLYQYSSQSEVSGHWYGSLLATIRAAVDCNPVAPAKTNSFWRSESEGQPDSRISRLQVTQQMGFWRTLKRGELFLHQRLVAPQSSAMTVPERVGGQRGSHPERPWASLRVFPWLWHYAVRPESVLGSIHVPSEPRLLGS